MATIKDVARLAGVSIATVSATLNGTARVSEVRASDAGYLATLSAIVRIPLVARQTHHKTRKTS